MMISFLTGGDPVHDRPGLNVITDKNYRMELLKRIAEAAREGMTASRACQTIIVIMCFNVFQRY